MSVNQLTAKPIKKTVGDPSDSYSSMLPLWKRSRAILNGEAEAKAHDDEVGDEGNLLIPFSPSMSQSQFDFYKSEAELPGLTAQYAKVLVSSLLRKESTLYTNIPELSDEENKAVTGWLKDDFTQEGQSMFSFLDAAIWEELQTFNSWVYVDLANFDGEGEDEGEETDNNNPYASLYKAENVINVQLGNVISTGKRGVSRFTTRYVAQKFTDDNPWHPSYVDTVCDHYLDESGYLTLDFYEKPSNSGEATASNGEIKQEYKDTSTNTSWTKVNTVKPLKFGERISIVPAWPLNGQFVSSEPALMPLVDREAALYNKVSRRNHLMYGASTYTPVVTGVTDADEQDKIVDAGLGSWLFLPDEASASMLETPSAALGDMEKTIAATVDEMAKMGIRMMSPETAQSGVALELRNASQTAQLGTLNTKISEIMTEVISFMISWKYNIEVENADIEYSLSADFTPVAGGSDSMRLVTEWYQSGLIPRSIFLSIARYNDFIPADYDDVEANAEIEADPLVMTASQTADNSMSYE